ncbi:hypothetical protein SmJEL517_g00376 [Synchytrium microbalum]|uniref:Ran-GTPase activating protein 1 C-terminal domain-containing protein n=1 Tax=Synchytrium microbalum TaxID=1806994 RepID=A0A507CG36_9FUNG|nr:uncharacterized protein SmJEL517_g00376 [Synchytrium microbalum]TPX38149.1 hypothetical protein SmJEL517_g00376 [Synchytrium microbalum]
MLATETPSIGTSPIKASSKMPTSTVYTIGARGLKLNTAEDAQELIAEMNQIQNLSEVVFSGNTVGVEAGRAFAAALKDKILIQKVNLSDMFTGRLREEIPLVLDAFAEALEDKEHLVEVDMSDNAFGPAGAKPLMRLLSNNRHIQVLRFNNNGLGIEGGRLIASALLEAQETNVKEGKTSSLRVFIAGRNRLESKGAEHLSKVFAAHASLTEIRMPQNSIRPEGIEILASALAHCTQLETLDLQDNTFTDTGSMALAKALPVFTNNLRHLNIGDCLLGIKGSAAIIKALTPGHELLERVNLAFGEIDTAGAALIPDMITNKKSLAMLELNGNAFDAESSVVQHIKDILRSHDHPDALDELDDMDYEEDEEEDKEEEEEEKEPEADQDDEVDALANKLSGKLEIE